VAWLATDLGRVLRPRSSQARIRGSALVGKGRQRRGAAIATSIRLQPILKIAKPRAERTPRDFTLFETIRVIQQHGPNEIGRHDVDGILPKHAPSIETVAVHGARPGFDRIVYDCSQERKYGKG
jgi:hypothetical protein